MILGEVEETITTVEIDDETYEEIIKVRVLLFQSHPVACRQVSIECCLPCKHGATYNVCLFLCRPTSGLSPSCLSAAMESF